MKHQISYPNLPQRLLKARERLMANFRPILNHFNITEQQWRILRVLDERGQLEPKEIGELCQISSPSMAGILARMEDIGLIRRGPVPGDQRRVAVELAKKGISLMGQIGPLIDRQYACVEQACGKQILADLFRVLDTFIEMSEREVRQVDLPAAGSGRSKARPPA